MYLDWYWLLIGILFAGLIVFAFQLGRTTERVAQQNEAKRLERRIRRMRGE